MPTAADSQRPFDDVRMRGFAKRTTVAETLAWLDARLQRLSAETVPLATAAGRVLAADVRSEVDVPRFDRSMMDGFAVRADDTLGAAAYNRLPLRVVGEVLPGVGSAIGIGRGQAMRIMTGAPLPPGADSVLPAEKVEAAGILPCVERTESSSAETDALFRVRPRYDVLALDEVSPGKNVGRQGEDIRAGVVVLAAGRVLRPQDVGVLASIGMATVLVVRRPQVRIVVTGNELVPAGSQPTDFQIVDANGPMLSALIARDGGESLFPGIVPDHPAAILAAMRDAADVVIVSGGSSVGQEDHAPALVAKHGELAIHGIAMRPSSPTGLGLLDDRLVFLLPGNPVSCFCAYDFFAGRAIRTIGGRSPSWPYRSRTMPLRRKLVSMIGRLDYARVKLIDGAVEPLAIAGASVLSSTTRAEGFVIVPEVSEGFPEGADVTVWMYDAVEDDGLVLARILR